MDNNAIIGYIFKADIKHYFETVNHEILLRLIRVKIKDEKVMWLIETILKNHKIEVVGRGMPLGNLTSQFFANFYLNELDYFVKHELNAEYYIRYVDDFVILHNDKRVLENWEHEIDIFLRENLKIELHPEKTRIIPLRRGITFLGFRIFTKYRLLKKSNARRIWKRLDKFKMRYDKGEMSRKEIVQSLEGWLAYAEFANSYKFRKRVAARFNELFGSEDHNKVC
ncbi:MAG: RNA-directed DNA polymerase [Candidatus Micrarchaeota archaeon]